MSALNRLRALEILRKGADPEPTKPTKAPFDGFVGAPPPSFLNNLRVANETAIALGDTENASDDAPCDPGYERRRAKALALLDEEPSRRLAVVAEAPKPGEAVGHVCTAVRHVAVADLTIRADKYIAFELWALMEQHGHA